MNLWGLVTSSFWLWWLTGAVLWAFIGVLVSSSTGLALWLGALAGAVGWFVGVAMVLVVVLARGQRHRSPASPPSYEDGARFAAPPVSGFGDGYGFDQPSTASPFASTGSGFASGSGFGGGTEPSALTFGCSDPPSGGRTGRELSLGRLALLIAAALAGGLLVLSDFGSWVVASAVLNGQDSPLEQVWGPNDFIPLSIWLLASGVLVGICAALAITRGQCRYLIVAALVIAPWFTLAVQLMLATTVLGTVGTLADFLSDGRFGAAVSTRWGLWCGFGGSVLAVLVVLSVSGVLLTARHHHPYRQGLGR